MRLPRKRPRMVIFSRDRVVNARIGTRQPGRAGASHHPMPEKAVIPEFAEQISGG
jgi:hypothetical protein